MIDMASQIANAINNLIEERIRQNNGDWRRQDGETDPFYELRRLLRAALPCPEGK